MIKLIPGPSIRRSPKKSKNEKKIFLELENPVSASMLE